jgi:hypothetical protein
VWAVCWRAPQPICPWKLSNAANSNRKCLVIEKAFSFHFKKAPSGAFFLELKENKVDRKKSEKNVNFF